MNLAQAFQAQCHVTNNSPDWFVYSGASTHMASSLATLDSASTYAGSDHVVFGNGNTSSISHIGNSSISKDLKLSDAIVVPNFTKNLLSISKLTKDSLVDVLFSNPFFAIQNRATEEILAEGRCENGLYVLKNGQEVFLTNLRTSKLCASYELWHTRLVHAAFDTISLLNKSGCLSFTSLLPKPSICSSCQFSKSKQLSFTLNENVLCMCLIFSIVTYGGQHLFLQ